MRHLFSVAHALLRAASPLLVTLFCALLHAEPADSIYTARYVVTMDARHDLIDNGAVAVRGRTHRRCW